MGLNQASAEIATAYAAFLQDRIEQRRLRQPIELIDRLLEDLEALNLRGARRVPLAFERPLRELAGMVRHLPLACARVGEALPDLRVKVGIPKLMDALYALQECVFAYRAGKLGLELIPDY